MGLLDDAIRQHLELKRRHGADPSDVAKLEHEAFGPTARAEPVATSTPDSAATTPESVYEDELHHDEAELEADDQERLAEPVPPPPEPVAPVEAPIEPVAGEREPPASESPPEPAAPPPAPEPLRPGGSVRLDEIGERTADRPTADHEPDPQPDAEPGEHDELEETPEFLQETPEHDRLWFEQKPPRDFDF